MTEHRPIQRAGSGESLMVPYLESLALFERLHRLLLDIIKDEFERRTIFELNPVQALLLFNIGENEVTAGELTSRGYYQGSNVSYNLKKLVEKGYMSCQRCEIDRRAVRVRVTARGRLIRDIVSGLFTRHARALEAAGALEPRTLGDVVATLKQIEGYWSGQIRHIY